MRNFILAAAMLVLAFFAFAGVGSLVEIFFPAYFGFSNPSFIDYVLVGQASLIMLGFLSLVIWLLSSVIGEFTQKKGV